MSTGTPHLVPLPAQETAEVSSARRLLNFPNFLTLFRIVLVPVFVVFVSKHRFTFGLYVFGVAALTDGLDGTVARWCNSKTELGAFLDPFADKLLLLSSFVVLTIEGIFPAWVLSVVVIRDVVIVFGYLMLSFFTDERIPVKPSYIGKVCTFLQLVCVVGALLGFATNSRSLWFGLLYLTVVLTGASGLQYTYRGLVLLKSREPQMFS